MNELIPKVIHYCWFGGSPLPLEAQKCIASWKKYFPDYEIKEWNETNFDLNCCDYVQEAYQSEKWSFVSDYARFYILYQYGGLYFDTDVEVVKDFTPITSRGAFMGCQPSRNKKGILQVNAGLGLGAAAGMPLYRKVLDYYNHQHFLNSDGSQNLETVVSRVTNILRKYGFRGNSKIEQICNIWVYPPEYFCPLNYFTGEYNKTENTFSIHHFSASWISSSDKIIYHIERRDRPRSRIEYRIRRVLSFPFRAVNKLKKMVGDNSYRKRG